MTIRMHPLSADIELARAIARHSRPLPERISGALTWGADEYILTALAVGWWLWCRAKPWSQRDASDHVPLIDVWLPPSMIKKPLGKSRRWLPTMSGARRRSVCLGKRSRQRMAANPN